MPDDIAARLRGIPTLTGTAPTGSWDSWHDTPEQQFLQWLDEALEAGVPEPLAMAVATADGSGPDVRVLLLKDVGPAGWAFASELSSPKAGHLRENPAAALSFWWQPQARAVRVRGRVVEADAAESAADLAARPDEARARIPVDDWALWRVVPDSVEFWQAAPDRRHLRTRYERTEGAWAIRSL